MNFWLVNFLARLIGGERMRKATREDYRRAAWFAVCLPVAILLFTLLAKDAKVVVMWGAVTLGGVAYVFSNWWLAPKIPAWISALLALVAWGAFIWFNGQD